MDKSLLKSGDFIFVTNHSVNTAYPMLVIEFDGGLVCVSDESWFPLATANVSRAFRPDSNKSVSSIFVKNTIRHYVEHTNDFDEIFEEKPTEVTLEEIADKLNINVKQLRIKE